MMLYMLGSLGLPCNVMLSPSYLNSLPNDQYFKGDKALWDRSQLNPTCTHRIPLILDFGLALPQYCVISRISYSWWGLTNTLDECIALLCSLCSTIPLQYVLKIANRPEKEDQVLKTCVYILHD